MVEKYIDGSGKQRVCGGRDLKGSQSYPTEHSGMKTAILSWLSNQAAASVNWG